MKIKDNYEFDTHTRMISISHFNIKLWSWSEYGAKFKRINNNILYNQLQFSNQKLNLEKMSEFSNWCYRLQIVWCRTVSVVTRYEVCDVYNGCRVMSRDEMYLCDWLWSCYCWKASSVVLVTSVVMFCLAGLRTVVEVTNSHAYSKWHQWASTICTFHRKLSCCAIHLIF